MESFQLTTPVVFIIFNRPDKTKIVFEEIRKAKPNKLLVIADGPRADRSGEDNKCREVREIIETVDWECEVIKNYSDINLGCKKRVSSGLDWAFKTVDEAIILEDDCLPHQSFFRFCQELLEKYRYDERIMIISGNNYQRGINRINYSYYFSRYPHIWGWASWRRSWQYYDLDIKLWPEVRDNKWLDSIFHDKNIIQFWYKIFEDSFAKKTNAWDYQLSFASLVQNKLNIMPNINLISNIGFDSDATHTFNPDNINANLKTEAMNFPLTHPNFMIRNAVLEKDVEQKNFAVKSLYTRIINKIKRELRVLAK